MKTISTQLSYFLEDRAVQRNLWLLVRYVLLLIAVIFVFTVGFHFIMLYVEGEQHSWITGLYWTLTVMSTLGFGDITFQSDIGRLFSVVVLMTGIVMLLIVLPFAFIRFFYAPWLEAQIRNRAPRALPADTRDHVILCHHDPIAKGVIDRLERDDIPYVVLEPDPRAAGDLLYDGVTVMAGNTDSRDTYDAARASQARFVLANQGDVDNTNVTLTVREAAPDVPIAAIVNDDDSQDILELSGATHTLPIKRWLGEQLASRINAQHAELHPIGQYRDLRFAELPVHNTPLQGKSIREAGLRDKFGVTVGGVWERGTFRAAQPDYTLGPSSVPVVVGTTDQLQRLNERISPYDVNPNPVLVIGGGTVGRAAVRTLSQRDVPVHLVERNPERCQALRPHCEAVFQGDASEYTLLRKAGIDDAPSVLLTTNDDAVNIYLASYCRRLNPELRVVSRITHERNLEAIHRAGADFVLSYATLGVEAVYSALKGKRLVVLGEGVDLLTRDVPSSLRGRTLAESEIGARTGLNVVAIEHNGTFTTDLTADSTLPPNGRLIMIGTDAQASTFVEQFEQE
ncbi:potassium transporter TrkA [Salinibacter sp. 10B]|uniref:potassium channel family protein n=1 Tax=Salinibacter sp. 10B TaxID=1923971 RepID=UPI000CF3A43A|nr:potassium channel protein [Salinibacter sp. 10B]PQJ34938.1 potassium transporter TrkA [Salinibacter sp. 10B]